MTRLQGWVTATISTVVVLVAIAIFIISRDFEVFYSRGQRSGSTPDAQHRGVFVAPVAVVPSAIAIADSVDLRVIDAWVEHPTHVEYRWGIQRREVHDSVYQVVIRLAEVLRDGGQAWAYGKGRCIATYRAQIDGRNVGSTGNADVTVLFQQSSSVFGDTVHLSVVRHKYVPLPGVPELITNRCKD